jgi:hypothetical protein
MTEQESLVTRLREMRSKPAPDFEHDLWYCKIGQTPRRLLPNGADAPMREAVREQFRRLTGKWPDFIFSGWGQRLTESEQAAADERAPEYHKTDYATLTDAADTIERLSQRNAELEAIEQRAKEYAELHGTTQDAEARTALAILGKPA